MIQSFINRGKNTYFINFFIYLIPIAIIVGQASLNALSAIISILIIFLIYKKKEYHKYKFYFYFFYFLITFLIINLYFSTTIYLSFISILSITRYFFFFLAVLYSLNTLDNFYFNFTRVLLVAVIFVVIDSYIQYFFYYDLFGNPILHNRLTGPFGTEKVIGAYISKLIFISFGFLLIKKIHINYISLMALAAFIVVILSNERSSSIMLLAALLIFLSFSSIKAYLKLIVFGIVVFFLFLVFNYNKTFEERFINEPKKYYKDNHHKAHFLTAIEIYKNNRIAGSGIKSFRVECKKKKYEIIKSKYIDNRCATHPHNIYLEILSETGIFGILIFLTINLYIGMYLIINFLKKKKLRNEILFIFCNFFILFFPLQTTGSFFSSWNGAFYWIFFAFFFNLKEKLAKSI